MRVAPPQATLLGDSAEWSCSCSLPRVAGWFFRVLGQRGTGEFPLSPFTLQCRSCSCVPLYLLCDHSRDSQFLLSSGSCLAQNKGRLVESTSSCGLTVSTSPKPPDVCAGRLVPAVSNLTCKACAAHLENLCFF